MKEKKITAKRVAAFACRIRKDALSANDVLKTVR